MRNPALLSLMALGALLTVGEAFAQVRQVPPTKTEIVGDWICVEVSWDGYDNYQDPDGYTRFSLEWHEKGNSACPNSDDPGYDGADGQWEERTQDGKDWCVFYGPLFVRRSDETVPAWLNLRFGVGYAHDDGEWWGLNTALDDFEFTLPSNPQCPNLSGVSSD